MKRLLILMVAAAMALMAAPAFAVVDSTPHDYTTNTVYGLCETCHVPHAAQSGGSRLWRTGAQVLGAGWGGSEVGRLCGFCHNGGGMVGNNDGGQAAHNVGATAYAANAHGRDMGVLDADINGPAGPIAGKPYTAAAGDIQCSSCHNPHDDTLRPFLRTASPTISGFCAECHTDRLNTDIGDLNNGNHPVNVLYTDNVAANGVTTLNAAPNAALRTLVPSAAAWVLGGKFQTAVGGGVHAAGAVGATHAIGCQTCHAIHNPAGAAGTDALYLLAIGNTGAGGFAALCEGCHGGPANGTNVGTGTDHPIDSAATPSGPSIVRWTDPASTTAPIKQERGAVGARWPQPSAVSIIMCTSCHSAHEALAGGTAADTRLRRVGRDNDAAAPTFAWCVSCHQSMSPLGHHSNDSNSSSVVSCDNCHSSGGSPGAHNGFSFTTLSGDNTALCQICHTAGDPAHGAYAFAGNIMGTLADHLGPDVDPSQSHYLGAFSVSGANSINVKTGNWGNGTANRNNGTATDVSKYGAGQTLGCESCHAILGNIGAGATATASSGYMANLLLGNYVDDSMGDAGSGGVGSGFCTACHNTGGGFYGSGATNGVPSDAGVQDDTFTPGGATGMHPMTNWSITRAVDAGRVPATLITAGQTYANAAGAPAGNTTYPAANAMDCDSCHRPHLAPANSTFTRTKTQSGTAVPVITEIQAAADETSDLCLACHNY
jgi:predicted CXXCH cytochrome family protein